MNTNPDTNPNLALSAGDLCASAGIPADSLLRAQITAIASHDGYPLNEAALLCHIGPDMTITSRIAFETPHGLMMSEIDATGTFFGLGMEAITEVATGLVSSFASDPDRPAHPSAQTGNFALVILNLTSNGRYYTPGTEVPDFFSRLMFQQAPTLSAEALADDSVALTLLEMAEKSLTRAA